MRQYNCVTKKLVALLTVTMPSNNRYIPVDVIDRYIDKDKSDSDILTY